MRVELIAFTPDPERIAAMAAKLTHTSSNPAEVANSDDKELQAILKEVMKRGHTSVIEHATFTFAISGVSRALTHQLVRHRIASYAQQVKDTYQYPNQAMSPLLVSLKTKKL